MAMDDEEIPRDAWKRTLEALTGEHEGDVASIEVAELDLGDQFEAEQIPFSYIEYDPHDDGRYPVMLRHVVAHPQSIFIHNAVDSVTIEVRSPDGSVTLVTLRARSELPA